MTRTNMAAWRAGVCRDDEVCVRYGPRLHTTTARGRVVRTTPTQILVAVPDGHVFRFSRVSGTMVGAYAHGMPSMIEPLEHVDG